ncbi:FAD synthetase [Salipiger sp. P9]|uniref:FAD synthetase n=1 Tax=Salipiger pentaromativorans TaxID=2943193 RepID=UPI0021579385|nr:FAD synthetase [Salipiger pentaromativorans]MCR8547398.1 FAD synthetase [Salipiger pentaromativorans]
MLGEYSGSRTEVMPEGLLDLPGSVVTIGAFDGVHRGHQALIRKTVARAQALGLPAVVWTFDPPPKVFFAGLEQLSRLDDKLARIGLLSPDYIVVASFTETYRKRSAEAFLEVLGRLRPAEVHVGGDFRFGAQQAGDVALLSQRFPVVPFAPVCCAGEEVVSSSRIRRLRAEGRRDLADRLHGSPGTGALLAGRLVLDQTKYAGDPDV